VELMRIGYRQAKHLWKRYQAGGAAALKHGNAGRKSNRARAEKERRKILKRVRGKYRGDQKRASGPRWQPGTWPRGTDWRCLWKRCGAGCWRTGREPFG
jgi:hypothetical protein